MLRFAPNEIMSLIGERPRFDLAESYGPNLHVDELLDAQTRDAVGKLALDYRTAPGDLGLRTAISRMDGVDADDVVITVGGMHALFLLAFILCTPGDEAVVTSPIFPPARGALEAVGATIRTIDLTFDGRYRLDPADVRPLLSERTKLVCVASPQNPSGVAIPTAVLAKVYAMMRERAPHAYLLVDESYRDAAFGYDPVAPSALTLGPRAITTASLSKCHGAPGLRLGWVITRDRALHDQLVIGKFNTVVSSPAIEEFLALRLFAVRDRILAERRAYLATCLARTASWVERNAAFVEWVRPDAGALCCVRLRPDVFDDTAVDGFYAALGQAGINVAKGTWFGDEARVFRLGFARLELDELDAAYEAFTAVLARTAGVPA
ncbi:MAG TPA: pyridoxal phosphate-dependent aminotransferase [Candidatus Aquilonibacter sp.]